MKILVSKIPIEDFRQDANDGLWKLGSMCLTSPEYGFAEKYNQIIDVILKQEDEILELRERVMRLELK